MNSERIIESSVSSEYDGMRIDLYLSKRFNYLSRTEWQQKLKKRNVKINGIEAKHNKKVLSGDIIVFEPEYKPEPEIDPDYRVVYEDEFFLGISKSGNLPVHPSGAYYRNTLTEIIEEKSGYKVYPMHRLDRETSGLIMMGKKSEFASAFQKRFGEVEKKYLAIVSGIPVESEFSVNVPMGPARFSSVNKKREAYAGAYEDALTKFTLLQSNDIYSLIEASPVTGRTHQIRVHMEYLNLPILGDLIYGGDESLFLRLVDEGDSQSLRSEAGFARCALHSWKLSFKHPFSNKYVEIESPLPGDMENFIKNNGLGG